MKYFKIKNEEIITAKGNLNVIWGEEGYSYGTSEENLTNPFIQIQFNDLPQSYKNHLHNTLSVYRENIYKTLDEKIAYKKQYFTIESRNVLAIFNESNKANFIFQLIEFENINIYCLEDNVEKYIVIPKAEAIQEYKKYITYITSLTNNFITFKNELELLNSEQEIDKKLNQFIEINKLV